MTVPQSIPPLASPGLARIWLNAELLESFAIRAAEASAKARQETAFGDARYTWRPIISMFAQYGRLSPINNVSEYYNLHGNYNTAAIGLQGQVLLLDANRRARARESMAVAPRAFHEVDLLRVREMEDDWS